MSRHFIFHLGRCGLWSLGLLAMAVGPLSAESLSGPHPLLQLPEWLLPLLPLLAVPLAAGLFMMTFSLFHDAAHGALALPQRVNDVVLFLTSAPLVMSAHGQRQLHLRHHANPLDADDLEGEGALASLWWAALTAPAASVHMRVAAVDAVNARVRPWVLAENGLNLLVAGGVIASGNTPLQLAFAVALLLQLTMNAWASHIPHRAPRWLLSLAARLEWTRSPVVLALVYHLEHHAHPRLPCALLGPSLPVISPLTSHNEARGLGWAQLKMEGRPRPRAATR